DPLQQTPSWAVDSADLTIAVSPVMAPVLQEFASQFNSQDNRTPDDQKMTVWIVPTVSEQIVEQSLGLPNFQAIAPDSSLWLDQLEANWAALQDTQTEESQIPISQRRTGTPLRVAVSPIVIAAWEDVARELGWPDQPVGWQEIQRKATEDPDFKWNHPATNNAAG